jgi:hypothetical protein
MKIRFVYNGVEKEYDGEDAVIFGITETDTPSQVLEKTKAALNEEFQISDGIEFTAIKKELVENVVGEGGIVETRTPVWWVMPNPVAG